MKEIISIIVIGTKKFFDFFLRKLVAINDSFTSFIAGTMIQIFALKISLFSE